MKKVVTFGEIMLRLSPPGFLRFTQATSFDAVYGGGESNVAVSLANYGIPVAFVTKLPKNEIGDAALMELRKRGVNTDHILRGGDRLGIYFLETGAVARGSNVIYDRAHSAISGITPGEIDWENIFKDTQWFHWSGITPAISQSAADVCLEAVTAASALGITVSTDLNYRKKLWNYGKDSEEIMTGLVAHCDVILGNEEDAYKHFGIHPEGVDVTEGESIKAEAFESVCKQLMQKFPKASKIITTLRGSMSASHNSWSGIMYNGTQLFTSLTHQITHIVDRVGGGDSFMGGLIYGLLSYDGDDQKALDFAVAASSLKHTIYGDANLITVAEVEKLMNGDASGRVSRLKIDALLDKIQQFPVIPVFYNNSVEITLDVVSVCYEGGMRVFEFTNRGQESNFVFKALIEKRKQFPEMSIGIGTVMDEAQATEFIDLGADFVVSPILDQHVAVVCQQTNKPWVPGCGTLTEVINAQRLGAELIKIFPGNVLGPGFVKSVLGPCPHLKLMPTGGVKPTQENLNEWFKAGVFSVGMGSSLFNREIVQPQNHQVLKAKILHIKKIVNNAQC